MLHCWNAKPESRPLFNEIEERLGKLMQESVKEVSTIMILFDFSKFAKIV